MRSIDAGTSNGGSAVRVAVTTTGASRPARPPARPAPARHRPGREQRRGDCPRPAALARRHRRRFSLFRHGPQDRAEAHAPAWREPGVTTPLASGVFPKGLAQRCAHDRRCHAPTAPRSSSQAKTHRNEGGTQTWQQQAATQTGGWRWSPAAWAASARSISTKMADAGYKVVVTYSPGNTKHGEWVARHEGQRLRHPRRAVRRRRLSIRARARSAEVQSKVGAVDVLVNNAGITRDMTFKKMDKVNWDAVMRTNLDSLFNMTQAGRRRHGRAQLGPHHQRLVGERLEGRVRPDQLLGRQGRRARLHQGARARGREEGRHRQHDLAGLHRHEDGDRDSRGHPRHRRSCRRSRSAGSASPRKWPG